VPGAFSKKYGSTKFPKLGTSSFVNKSPGKIANTAQKEWKIFSSFIKNV
jgi:hypothetical protein